MDTLSMERLYYLNADIGFDYLVNFNGYTGILMALTANRHEIQNHKIHFMVSLLSLESLCGKQNR